MTKRVSTKIIKKSENRNTKKDYINKENNLALLESIKIYQAERDLRISEGKPLPNMPNTIGIAVHKIAENFAHNYSFRNYIFKDEMIADAIEAMIKSVDAYDAVNYSNPFSYFTTSAYYAFIQRIEKEKKHLYTKFKSLERSSIALEAYAEEFSGDQTTLEASMKDMHSFVISYEETLQKRKDEKALKLQAALKALEILKEETGEE